MSLIWPILRQAIRKPRQTAIIDDQRSYTYMQLAGASFYVAEEIRRESEQHHVGLMLPTSGAFPAALLGAWIAGRAAVPLNFLLSPDELAYVIKDSGIDTIVSVRKLIQHLGGEERIPPGVKVLYMEDIDFTGLPPVRWPKFPAHDDNLACLLYTSGTSGRPKGVMLTHRNLQANVEGAIVHAGLTEDMPFFGVLPQFHSFGLTALTLLPLSIGAKVVYNLQFNPKRIIRLIEQHRPVVMMAVPSMYGALLSVKDTTPEQVASVKFAISGGEPLPDATFEAFEERYHIRLLEGYGLTETSPILTWLNPNVFRRHSVGRSLPGVGIRIVDDNDRALSPNQDGEILATGPSIMPGYFNLPDQTDAVFVQLPVDPNIEPKSDAGSRAEKMRYFRTGDIGHLDEDGFLFITGRKKEMLIIGGENVFPREIEEVLNQHPSVHASAIIGKADGMRGEVPVAFVELEEDATFDEPALRTWCRERLAGFKVPREIHHIDQLPRNPTGKIMRRDLKCP